MCVDRWLGCLGDAIASIEIGTQTSVSREGNPLAGDIRCMAASTSSLSYGMDVVRCLPLPPTHPTQSITLRIHTRITDQSIDFPAYYTQGPKGGAAGRAWDRPAAGTASGGGRRAFWIERRFKQAAGRSSSV